MGKAYSEDLRDKVLEACESGDSQRSISKRFIISEKTVYLWLRQRESRGHNRPITKYQKGHSHKIPDLAKFKEFVMKDPSRTAEELAKDWGNVSATCIKKHLKKLNFTRKKRLLAIKIGTKQSGQILEKNYQGFHQKNAYI